MGWRFRKVLDTHVRLVLVGLSRYHTTTDSGGAWELVEESQNKSHIHEESIFVIITLEPKLDQPCIAVNSIDTALMLLYDIRTVLIILV